MGKHAGIVRKWSWNRNGHQSKHFYCLQL